MFSYMIAVARIPNLLLEMCAQNDVGPPVASFDYELDVDYL